MGIQNEGKEEECRHTTYRSDLFIYLLCRDIPTLPLPSNVATLHIAVTAVWIQQGQGITRHCVGKTFPGSRMNHNQGQNWLLLAFSILMVRCGYEF